MSMNSLIFFFSALGVFNGILLSLYLFVFSKQKSLSKYLLGALILALSIRIGKSIILYFDRDVHKLVLQIGLSACLFIGPLLYFYLRSVLDQTKKLPSKWMWSLLSLLAVIVVVGTIRPYHIDPVFWNAYVVNGIYCVWFIGVCAAGLALVPQVIKSYGSKGKISPLEKWLSAIFLGNVIIATAFFMALFGYSWGYYISGPLVFSFFLYILAFGYFNDKWFETASKPTIEKYQNKKIDGAEAEKLLKELYKLMNNKKIFTNPTLKLKTVADHLNIPSHQLSQLLNDNLGKGFKPFINEHRIKAACQLLGTKHQLSLEGVGYEVGFRSKSTFFTTFKKLMNVTPAQYQEQLSLKTSQNGSIL